MTYLIAKIIGNTDKIVVNTRAVFTEPKRNISITQGRNNPHKRNQKRMGTSKKLPVSMNAFPIYLPSIYIYYTPPRHSLFHKRITGDEEHLLAVGARDIKRVMAIRIMGSTPLK